MFNRRLSSFIPPVYDGIVEFYDVINTEERAMDLTRAEMSAAFANTFVLTANESGVIMFEKMLNITANPQTEDLEFRRDRILNRMAMSPPFTFRFLKQKLDEIIGVGAWDARIDFNNYTLYIEASASNQNWHSELEFTISRVKPCNMVFINVPRITAGVNLSEEVSYARKSWKYRLGSWRLSQTAFAEITEGGVLKVAETKSIRQGLLNDTASFVVSDIASVVINGTITVSEFSLKKASDNVVSIEYSVDPRMTNMITDIQMLKADGTVLTQSVVYVPVTDTVMCKHTITVKEGV